MSGTQKTKRCGVSVTMFAKVINALIGEYGDRPADPVAMNEIAQLARKIEEVYCRLPKLPSESKP